MKKLLIAAALALGCTACAGGLAGIQGPGAIGAETSTELRCRSGNAALDAKAPTPAEANAKLASHDAGMVRVHQVRALYDRTLRARAGEEENDRLDRARGETDDACGRYRSRLAGFADSS